MRVELLSHATDDGATVYTLARLRADAAPAGERSPVNLALVIDRSSSMRGPRIRQAIRAALEVVDKLEERDRLSVITFDAAAQTVFGPAPMNQSRRMAARAALEAIETGVGTNLAAGIKKGAEAIRSGFVRGATSRLVMLSDGQPSIGLTDAERLGELAAKEAARGMSITTMGLGVGFDDELLIEVSSRGRGGFYFLATAADVAAAFGRELAGLFAIAASQTELKLLPSDDILAAEVLHRLPSRTTDDGLVVELGELAAGAPRQVLFRLTRLPQTRATRCGTIMATYRRSDGTAGDGHILGIELPSVPIGTHLQEVTFERLRLTVATAVDVAWARRACGDRSSTLGVLSAAKHEVDEAKVDRSLSEEHAVELLSELRRAKEAVTNSSQERERIRRSMRERSHVTMLGHSLVRELPADDDEV